MRNKRKKRICVAVCAALAACITGVAFWWFWDAAPQSSSVSTGLQYLADRTVVAASAPIGEQIVFHEEWFDKTLQGERVSAITVTELPDVTQGELLLGYGEVSVGQRIGRENFSYLTFVPLEGVRSASFCFVPEVSEGSAGYALRCSLSLTDGVNCCPSGSGAVKAVSTHATLALNGTLEAEDPEGDGLSFEVVRYPEHGTLSLEASTGRFCYLPAGDFSGEDAFVWRVQDTNGGFSEEQSVSVTVHALTGGYVFCDMEGSDYHSAALLVSEKGLMSGEMLGKKHYFHPERSLTRAAFVAILLQAAEIECPPCEQTGFADNDAIPHGMRGAIAYAKEQGWLGEEEQFRPNDPITRAEAAKIATRVLSLDAPGYNETAEDHGSIPVSVVDALYAAWERGYIATATDGSLLPERSLTRAEAAVFFLRVSEQIS